MSDLDQPNIGSHNFGSAIWLAVPFQMGSSPISVQSIDLLLQRYQLVADEPFAEIYTVTGSQPGTPVANAMFTPPSPLTSGIGISVFNDATAFSPWRHVLCPPVSAVCRHGGNVDLNIKDRSISSVRPNRRGDFSAAGFT